MRKLGLALLVVASMSVGAIWTNANATVPVAARRAHYALQSDLFGYPYTLRLRHCAPAEDTLGKLIMVDYRPADSVVIYRCRKPSAY